MKHGDIQMNEMEIRIYHSLWRNMLTVIIGLVCAVVCGWILLCEDCPLWVKVVSGWMGVIFFGGGGLLMLVALIYNSVHRIPYLIIHEDRLDIWIQTRFRYYTVNFKDVRRFRLQKLGLLPNAIAIDYLSKPFHSKMDKSSGLMRKLMSFNVLMTGAAENISTADLTMNSREICDILNARLGKRS